MKISSILLFSYFPFTFTIIKSIWFDPLITLFFPMKNKRPENVIKNVRKMSCASRKRLENIPRIRKMSGILQYSGQAIFRKTSRILQYSGHFLDADNFRTFIFYRAFSYKISFDSFGRQAIKVLQFHEL